MINLKLPQKLMILNKKEVYFHNKILFNKVHYFNNRKQIQEVYFLICKIITKVCLGIIKINQVVVDYLANQTIIIIPLLLVYLKILDF